MRPNKHRKVGDSYYQRAQLGRMMSRTSVGRRVGLLPPRRATGWPRPWQLRVE